MSDVCYEKDCMKPVTDICFNRSKGYITITKTCKEHLALATLPTTMRVMPIEEYRKKPV